MSFKGFESPNFTQIPNDYLDYTVSPECDLSTLEMRIMNFFFRETYGWQEKTAQLVASVTDFQSLFNIQKRKSITDALDRLTNEKHFLQSVQVKQLPERTKQNIKKIVKRNLHPAQKLYRLNLIEYKDRSWDNVRNWENEETKELKQEFLVVKREKSESKKSNGYQEVPINGYQEVPINGYQEVPINGYQEVPIKTLESVGNKGDSHILNKGLNKGLNKSLNKDIYLSEIEESILSNPTKKLLLNKIDRLKYHSINISQIISHLLAKKDLVNEHQYINTLIWALDNQNEPIRDYFVFMDICINNYIKMQNKHASVVKNTNPVRKEIVPEYILNPINEQNNNNDVEESEEVKMKREELLERIKALGE